VIVSDHAHDVVTTYQKAHKIGTRDETIDKILLEFGKRSKKT
jgi:hypothetical protein